MLCEDFILLFADWAKNNNRPSNGILNLNDLAT